MSELLPRDSTEVDRGGPPEALSTEFVGLALLTEEYPEVVMSLPGSFLLWWRGLGPRAGGVWASGTWCPFSSWQVSSSLDSWQQCSSGFRYTTVTSRTPLGAVTVGNVRGRGREVTPQPEHQG